MQRLCHVLGVSRSAYYARQQRVQSPASEPVWETTVRRAFTDHSQRYGTRHLRPELAELAHAGVGR